MALHNEYISKSKPVLPNAKGIMALCREKGCGCNGFAYPSNGPIAYIKYGYTVTVGEMQTQRYVYNAFRQMTNGSGSSVKVPEIYHAFECEDQTYIVMEYVHGKTVGAWLRDSSGETRDWVYDQVAKAINQLLRVPVPSGSRPGPVGGGCIQHYFFRDKVAPKEYNSVSDLQNHINRVLRLVKSEDKVDFSYDQMCLCYADIMEDNFIITNTGQIYVIDFEDATFLPKSFMSFVLYGGTKPLARRISDKVSIPKSANHGAMIHASYVLNISSNSQLGL